MNALDHYRRGEQLLAQSERTPAEALYDEAIPVNRLLVEQARAHFEAARTLLAALSALDMPAHDYEAWEQHTLKSKAPKPAARDFELGDEEEGPAAADTAQEAGR